MRSSRGRNPVLSFFMATLAFLADFSVLFHFFAWLLAEAVINAPDIILCIWRLGRASREICFLVSATAFTTLPWRSSSYGIMLQRSWFTAWFWPVGIWDVVCSSIHISQSLRFPPPLPFFLPSLFCANDLELSPAYCISRCKWKRTNKELKDSNNAWKWSLRLRKLVWLESLAFFYLGKRQAPYCRTFFQSAFWRAFSILDRVWQWSLGFKEFGYAHALFLPSLPTTFIFAHSIFFACSMVHKHQWKGAKGIECTMCQGF